ncbi:MAG: DUF5694 domain-containing protein, partial [Pseudomonadota bacterium]
HFGNPGRDLNNVEADDVLSPRRQTELKALSDALIAFNPSAIAIERVAAPPYDDPGWKSYDQAMLQTEREESVQIAYRVASAAGVQRVYAIDETPDADEPDYHPYVPLATFAEKTGRSADLEAIADLSPVVKKFEEAQAAASIPELLLLWNGDEFNDAVENFYWKAVTFGEGEEQPGPELAAFWFLRNAKIFNKLVQVTNPGDRVIVVYGAGHGPWLRKIIQYTNGYELEPVAPYLDAAANAIANEDQ